MRCMSVRQPWAFLLCSGVKDIENRSWKLPEKYKGETILIHTSARPNISILESSTIFSEEQWNFLKGFDMMLPFFQDKLITSAIIGSVRFTDCVINHPSIWAEKTIIEQMECPECGCIESEYFGDGEHKCDRCKHTWWENENKPIYNWVATDAVLFEKPVLNIKGKLGFWDYDLSTKLINLGVHDLS